MKGKCKKILCEILASVTLLATPFTVKAQTIDTAKIAAEIENQGIAPVKSNKQINTKAKTITLYAGLTYRFRAEGFKEARANWKISKTSAATLEVSTRNAKIGAAVIRTKKAGTFTVTAVQGKKKYIYKVTVKNILQKRSLKVKEIKDNKMPKQISWSPMPGADGYIVYRRYMSGDGSPEFGWRDGQVEVLKVLKGNKITFYNVQKEGNWDIFWRMGWGWNAAAYKIVNGKVYISAFYEDDAYYNIVKLK